MDYAANRAHAARLVGDRTGETPSRVIAFKLLVGWAGRRDWAGDGNNRIHAGLVSCHPWHGSTPSHSRCRSHALLRKPWAPSHQHPIPAASRPPLTKGLLSPDGVMAVLVDHGSTLPTRFRVCHGPVEGGAGWVGGNAHPHGSGACAGRAGQEPSAGLATWAGLHWRASGWRASREGFTAIPANPPRPANATVLQLWTLLWTLPLPLPLQSPALQAVRSTTFPQIDSPNALARLR